MKKIIEKLKTANSFFRNEIWKIVESDLPKARRIYIRILKTIILTIREYIKSGLNVQASALTYSILFAIIPLFALIIAISKGFGVEKYIENSLQNTLMGQENLIPIIMGFVQRYLETTQGGVFIGIGLGVLFWSVMNFFMQVEKAFNKIWQVNQSRSIVRQFSTYFSSILIIPLLIVFSSGLSFFINSTLAKSYLSGILNPLLEIIVTLTPYVINWTVFTATYLIVPNTKVKFSNALIAGIIAGTSFQIFQILYIHGQIYLSRFNIVYGSFAAFPLLLLWIQISCTIVLLGAVISFTSQNTAFYEFEKDTKNISIRYRNFIKLYITHLIAKQFEAQLPPLTAKQIADQNKIPISLVVKILDELAKVSIITEVISNKVDTITYQPAIDIQQLTVKLLFTKLETNGSELFLSHKNIHLEDFWKKTVKLNTETDMVLASILVKDM